MARVTRRWASEKGITLVEMIVVVGIAGVLTGMAVVQISGSRPAALGDGAMRIVLSQMNTARELAITQRRNMRITFTLSNKIEILREEVPALATPTTISSVLMEGGMRFATVANLSDTPDVFCGGSIVPVSFPTATGSPLEVKFKPDGSFVNQDGATLNGTVFVALPGMVYAVGNTSSGALSARAVTILGSTGRVRAYRFDGRSWKPV